MKRIINGKLYDTEKSTRICSLPCYTEYQTDFRWHDTNLYRSPGGMFFIAGEGNAMSMWAKSLGQGRYSGGSGLHLVTLEEARAYAEESGVTPQVYVEAFGSVPLG